MRAVNLIPPESKRRGPRAKASAPRGPAVALIAALVIALAFVTIYVLTTNTIKDRRAKIATVQSQTAALQAQVKQYANYASFVKLAADREATVRQIATQRFDWHTALSDLSKVVPANTSLQSLLGTVAPGVTISGAGGGGGSGINTGSLRGVIPAPAFEMKGCTRTQDDVARLMSRLRLINGVTRVTLADTTKQETSATGATITASSAGNASCGVNTPSFDLVVFFKPLPGAASTTTAPGTPVTSTTTTTAGSTTPASTTPGTTTPGTTTTSSSSQTTSSTSGGSK